MQIIDSMDARSGSRSKRKLGKNDVTSTEDDIDDDDVSS